MDNEKIPKVSIVKSTYRKANINVVRLLDLINFKPSKEKVFIKPNFVDAYPPETRIITSPKVVEAVILFLKNFDISEIILGDGCAVHTNMADVFKKSKYNFFEKRYGIKLIDLDESKRKLFEWKYGSIMLPELIESHEYINIAKLKTHAQTQVSLCMKNQKGLLLKKDKKDFHRKFNLNESINLLNKMVKPDLNIIDGILSLEGRGPIHFGKPKKGTNLLFASNDANAIDFVAVQAMGFDPDAIKYMDNISSLEILGENLSCNRLRE